MTDCL